MNGAAFTVLNPFPRVYHIRDALGAHMTLLAGTKRALLFDAGYGLHDLPAQLSGIVECPLTVLLSHGHYDHVLGSRWFEHVLLPTEELPAYRAGIAPAQRKRVLQRAREAGIPLTEAEKEAYLSFAAPEPLPLLEREFDLGGLHARVWPMPGHTLGSVGLWVEEARLLLAGDNLNPVVWLFFKDCSSLAQYTGTMRGALYLPFANALCPHADRPFTRVQVEEYVEGLCPDTFRKAMPVKIPPYEAIDTRRCTPAEGFTLVYDGLKAQPAEAPAS